MACSDWKVCYWTRQDKSRRTATLVLLLLEPFLRPAAAAPSITFPISSQLPPVAQVAATYYYQFAPTTFSSTIPNTLGYALQGAPDWLFLDSSTRSFSGIPSSGDVGSISFFLEATDTSGQTRMFVALVVVASKSISAPVSITDQLESFGNLTNADTIALYTSTSFDFHFALNTFQGPIGMTYYATSANRSPLPSWLNFNANTATFSGLTPPLTAIPQTFGISLIATTIAGFAEASVTFYVVINDHRLIFVPFERSIAISNGSADLSTIVDRDLFLDGNGVSQKDLKSTTVDTPSWLSYNPLTMVLTGYPPAGLSSQNLTFTALDTYGDAAATLLNLQFTAALFAQDIGVLTATIGEPFNYTFPETLLTTAAMFLSINLGTASSWLAFDKSLSSLYGVVPRNLQPSIVSLSITAQSGSDFDTQEFEILIQRAPQETPGGKLPGMTSLTRALTTSGLQSPTSVTSPSTSNSEGLHGGQVAGIVIGCVLVMSIMVGLMVYFLRKRRQWKGKPKLKITVVREDEDLAGSHDEDQDLESQGGIEGLGMESSAPQIRGATDTGGGIFDSIASSNFGSENSVHPPLAESTLSDMTRGHVAEISSLSSREILRRHPKQMPQRSTDLVREPLAIGLGHGRPSYQASSRDFASMRSNSIQNRWSTFSSGLGSRRSQNTYSFAPQDLRRSRIPEELQKQSIRLVNNPDESRLDMVRRKRDSYIRRRASSARKSNPMFAANSTRISSRQSSHLRRSPPETASHMPEKEYSTHSSSVGATPSFPRVVQQTKWSLGHSGKSNEWEDMTESDLAPSWSDEDMEEGEEILRQERARLNDEADPIVTAKRRGKMSQTARRRPEPKVPRSSLLPQTPATSAGRREDSRSQDSTRCGKLFL